MQDPASELLRIPLPRTPVNKGKSKAGAANTPRPSKDLRCRLGEPDYRLLCCIGYLGVGASTPIEGVVAVHAILGVDRVSPVLSL